MSDHLVPFALRTAFPSSLVGRDSHDYYETSVAIGLACCPSLILSMSPSLMLPVIGVWEGPAGWVRAGP
jgi:hypothetical protein